MRAADCKAWAALMVAAVMGSAGRHVQLQAGERNRRLHIQRGRVPGIEIRAQRHGDTLIDQQPGGSMMAVPEGGAGEQGSQCAAGGEDARLIECCVLQMVDTRRPVFHGERNRAHTTMLIGMDLSWHAQAESCFQETHQQRTARHIGVPLEIGKARQAAAAE